MCKREQQERILLTDARSRQIRESRQHGITGAKRTSSNPNSGGGFEILGIAAHNGLFTNRCVRATLIEKGTGWSLFSPFRNELYRLTYTRLFALSKSNGIPFIWLPGRSTTTTRSKTIKEKRRRFSASSARYCD